MSAVRAEPLLQVSDLVVEFPAKGGERVHAVSGVSFDVAEGETLGLVGESGCGKSTTGRALLCLPRPTSGSVKLDGVEVTGLSGNALRQLRTRMQIIFQDPISSLSPQRRIADIVAEPLQIWGTPKESSARKAKVAEMMDAVGLDFEHYGRRRPHEFSGGQCQRVAIARALILEPRLLVCDEPVSALDVSVQAQILNLLEDMKARYGLTMVFISHDLSVIRHVSDRIAVMYLGKLCEIGPRDAVYANPRHPYTSALLASIPSPDAAEQAPAIAGELPSPLHPPPGCRFHTRCPKADEICRSVEPQLAFRGDGHAVACHHPD